MLPGVLSEPVVAVAADRGDENEQHDAVELVDDPVASGAHPPFAVPAHELPGSRRSGFVGGQFDRSPYPTLGWVAKRARA